jgi:hypothetical protein
VLRLAQGVGFDALVAEDESSRQLVARGRRFVSEVAYPRA